MEESANIGVSICLKCCGVHTSIGSQISKVLSVTLDEWSSDGIDAMIEIGRNSSANSIYEAYFPKGYTKPGPDASHEQRAKFIREKDSFGLEEHSGIDLSGNTDAEHDISNNTQENACKKQVESPNNNIEAEDVKEISHVVYKETGKASKVEVKDVKLNHPKEVQVNSVSKGSNAAKTKNKSMLPTSKASPISTPKSSKPA
ncbi:hypothetical protein JHK84_047861 [Glycine max]|nr:hypothetical protein JHK86_047838 [Glycine max]KAG4943805.1 hypothetical protein JHK85_048451 [Glycine max]KAG5102892.1 hypothetical protein JHK84_047861 [Glycine max]